MDRSAHFDGVKALMTAPLIVHDTVVPLNADGTPVRASYAVLYDLGPDKPPDDDRFTAPQTADSAVELRYVVRAVGETPHAAREVTKASSRQLIKATPAVAGRVCFPLRLDESGDVKQTEDVSPPLYFIDSHYLLRSQPA